jgi:tellurite methyltransferase
MTISIWRSRQDFLPRTIPIFCLATLFVFSFLSVPNGEAATKDKKHWNRKYDTEQYVFGKQPIPFLKEHLHLLPKGKLLDIAMGEGRNGVFLATKGFQVTGIDISETGLEKARTLAREQGASIETKVVDLEQYQLQPETYDVILCTYYVQRNLFPQMITALKPGGMVLVETYTMGHLKYRPHFKPEYLLEGNELLNYFTDLTILRYQVQDDGQAIYASILVQKN